MYYFILVKREKMKKFLKIYNNSNVVNNGSIDARGYNIVELNKVLKFENIDAWDASVVSIPEASESGYIDARRAKFIDVNNMVKSGYINAIKLPVFSARYLQNCNSLYLTSAKIVYAPQATVNGDVFAFKANNINLNEISGKLYCNEKTKFEGKCDSVIRSNKWIMVDDIPFIVITFQDRVYTLYDQSSGNTFYASRGRGGLWNYYNNAKEAMLIMGINRNLGKRK